MGLTPTRFNSLHLLGNTIVPRDVFPILRGGVRRTDPDGGSTYGYFPGLAGKKLDVEYTDAGLSVQTATITFAGNGLNDALAVITAITDLEGLSLDGFLAIRNVNPGDKHYLKITPQVTPGDEAAAILGFIVDPYPGSMSIAGSISSTPGIRSQGNRFGTALIGRDEDLTSAAINRGLAATLQYLDQLKVDLEREVAVTREVWFTASGSNGAFHDPNTRLAILPSTAGSPDALYSHMEVVTSYGVTQLRTNLEPIKVLDVHYGSPTGTGPFVAWGTPDGKSIHRSTIPEKVKHVSTAISSIEGNVVTCPGATFQTLYVQKGDPVRITGALNTAPFSHNGWFVIETVHSEEVIAVRAMSSLENPPGSYSNEDKPAHLNGSGAGLGNVEVMIGNFIPAAVMYFAFNEAATTGRLRVPVGVTLREALRTDFAMRSSGFPDLLGNAIKNHLDDATDAHAATAITGFTTTALWKNGGAVTGTTLKDVIENIVILLGSSGAGNSSLTRLGAQDVAFAASDTTAPTNLPAGDLLGQLQLLLSKLRAHMLDSGAHIGGVGYLGSPNWKDGTSVPASPFENAVDRVVSDLAAFADGATGSGAQKVGVGARTNWLGGGTNPGNVSVLGAINKIITDLASVTDVDDGAMRIGAQVAGDLPQGSVRSQLDKLSVQWAKMARANTFTQPQTLNGASGDISPTLKASTLPVVRKLLWEIASMSAGQKIRFYSTLSGQFEITINAVFNTPNWSKDIAGTATLLRLTVGAAASVFYMGAATSTWIDSAWSGEHGDLSVGKIDIKSGPAHKSIDKLSVHSYPSSTEHDKGMLAAFYAGPLSQNMGVNNPTLYVSDHGHIRHQGFQYFEEFMPNGASLAPPWNSSGAGITLSTVDSVVGLSGSAHIETYARVGWMGGTFSFETDVRWSDVLGDSYIGLNSVGGTGLDFGFRQHSSEYAGSENLHICIRTSTGLTSNSTEINPAVFAGMYLTLKATLSNHMVYWSIGALSTGVATHIPVMVYGQFAASGTVLTSSTPRKFRYFTAGQTYSVDRVSMWGRP